MKLFYYIRNYGLNALPPSFFRYKYKHILASASSLDAEEVKFRVNYYHRINQLFSLPEYVPPIKDYKKTSGTAYYLDLKEFLHYFKPQTEIAYEFGDSVKNPPFPTIRKARKIAGKNENAILFKLNKVRHFKWVEDELTFEQKQNKLVWRGGAYLDLRRHAVKSLWQNPNCNVGQTNKPEEDVPWQKPYMSIDDQLQYKYIFCPEGNDVATNLKWVMSSNSLCFMPKPTNETWFMEGVLKPGKHYVELKADYSDLDEKIEYYNTHIDEAKFIIQQAQQHVARFKNQSLEDLICIKVLEKYAIHSNQGDALKFC